MDVPAHKVLLRKALIVLSAAAVGVVSYQLQPGHETVTYAESSAPQYGDSLEQFLGATAADGSAPATSDVAGFQQIQWNDLVPPGFSVDEIEGRYTERLDSLEPGSPDVRALYEEMQAEIDTDRVNSELDGSDVVLAGFVAPVTYDGDLVTEFLLVPTFGACVHAPAPPPNQTVMVSLNADDGLTLDETWGAVWVAGNLTATSADTELGAASYSVVEAKSGAYVTT